MNVMERLKMQAVKGGLVFVIIIAGRFQSCSETKPKIDVVNQSSEDVAE